MPGPSGCGAALDAHPHTRASTRLGNPIDREATFGFHFARVVQHECDHLDGILYPMRVRDFSRLQLQLDVLDVPDVEMAEDEG